MPTRWDTLTPLQRLGLQLMHRSPNADIAPVEPEAFALALKALCALKLAEERADPTRYRLTPLGQRVAAQLSR